MSFRDLFLNALARKVLIAFAILAYLGIGQAFATGPVDMVQVPQDEVPGTPAYVMAQHGCWSGKAPADVSLPGHVVYSTGHGAVYGGSVMVGKALDQIFNNVPNGLVIYGFCR